MKFLSLIAVLFSFNAFAETTIQRTFDGKDARCETLGDTGKRFYKLEIQSENVTEDKCELVLNVLFYKCALNGNVLALVKSDANEVLHGHVLLNNGELGLTNNTLVSAKFALIDQNERLVGQSQVNLNEEAKTISFSFNKDIKRVFVIGAFKSTVELPTGEVFKDMFEYVGGFAINVK